MNIQYIRYYHHDLFPERSGIAVYDGKNWDKRYRKFDQDDLDFLKVNHPTAVLQNAPLPERS